MSFQTVDRKGKLALGIVELNLSFFAESTFCCLEENKLLKIVHYQVLNHFNFNILMLKFNDFMI